MSLKYSAEWTYTIGDCNQRCNHTMPKVHLLINEFLQRVRLVYYRAMLAQSAVMR